MCQQGVKRCSPSVVAARRKSKRRQKFVRERKDPAKMAHSRMALGKRGLGAKPANSNSIEHQEQGTHSCMRTQADRQGAGHGAVQLTFDDEEATDDRDEEAGLLTDGARTHYACCGGLHANPIQLQLPRKPLCWHVSWRLLPGHQSLQQLCWSRPQHLHWQWRELPCYSRLRETVMRQPRLRWRFHLPQG